MASRASARSVTCPARPSTLAVSNRQTLPRRQPRHGDGGRSPWCRTKPCWRRSAPISPWTGEGHRKVWARLRVIDGIRVARKRVLRLMRENALLSPHRARTRDDPPHDRHIITDAPNVMWATDATQIASVQDGKVWLFGVIEHWNA